MHKPLIVIVGETASGKTALAIDLAKKFNGEIIAADSRTIYKEMNIGTAKPTIEEREGVPHFLLDVISPSEPFSASEFKKLANQKIDEISARGNLSIMVGGTGLYVDSVIYDFTFRTKADPEVRKKLQMLSVPELQERITSQGLNLPVNSRNPVHLIRTIETNGEQSEKKPLRENTLVIGLKIDSEELNKKLTKRVDLMVEAGLVQETEALAKKYGWQSPGLQSTSYKALRSYLEGTATLEEAKQKFIQNDRRLAKRQRTWFRRNKDIHWICKKEEAVALITTFLNK